MTLKDDERSKSANQKQSRLIRRILFHIIGPTIGIICTYGYFYLSTEPNPALGIAIGLGVAFITNSGAISLMIDRTFSELEDHITKVKDDFKTERALEMQSRMKLSRVPNNLIDAEVMRATNDSDTVKNTFINMTGYYSDNHTARNGANRQYRVALENSSDRRWTDITTYSDFYSGRYDQLASQNYAGKLTFCICDCQIQFINFMVFERNDVPCEVIFGWIGRDGAKPEIYSSTEADLVNFFNQHFNSLQRSAVENMSFDGSKRSASSYSLSGRIVGTWLSLPPIRGVMSVDEYQYYSIVSVYSDSDGWRVRTDIYSRKDSKLRERVFSDRVFFHGDHVAYEGQREVIANHSTFQTTGAFFADESGNRMDGRYRGENGQPHSLRLIRLSQEASSSRNDVSYLSIRKKMETLFHEIQESYSEIQTA